jgi:hypothetical protein
MAGRNPPVYESSPSSAGHPDDRTFGSALETLKSAGKQKHGA